MRQLISKLRTWYIHSRKNEPNSSSTTSSNLVVEELWSYNQCERYVFGRQSFGGFNPVVEKNVRKGIWKPFYLEEGDVAVESSDEDEKKPQSDVDVSDEEMAKTYGSLIGTLAKRFNKRNEKGKRGNKNKNFKGKGNDQQKSKGKNWKKDNSKEKDHNKSGNRQQNQKRQRDSTGSTQQSPSSKRNRDNYDETDVPPQKKRKFLKPTD